MINALSVDLEDWFCVSNMSEAIPYDRWDRQELRVEKNTLALMDLFSRRQVIATFFVLGWIAERVPDLIREIDRRGHEIASHGYSHTILSAMTRSEFREDLLKALEVTHRSVSGRIRGFRAPSFSLTRKTLWAFDVLTELGFRYDSSVYPMNLHPEYGLPEAPLEAYAVNSSLMEIPLSCATVLGRRIPCSGGGYFRIFPYALTSFLFRRCHSQGRPVIFYLHPWEIDAQQPRQKLPAVKKFRHYRNLQTTYARLERLLDDFQFTSIGKRFAL